MTGRYRPEAVTRRVYEIRGDSALLSGSRKVAGRKAICWTRSACGVTRKIRRTPFLGESYD